MPDLQGIALLIEAMSRKGQTHLLTQMQIQPSSVTQFVPEIATPKVSDSHGYFETYNRVLATMPHASVEQVADELYQAFLDGRKVLIFGNGGSASLASHFACDLGKGTSLDGKSAKRFRVISLVDNLALLTAWANDTSYDHIFAEQIRNFADPGDIAFAISGSGNSPNVLHGLQAAREAGTINIGLGGFHGGIMKSMCDLCIVIPSENMQIIEDFHVSVTHALFTLVRHRIETQTHRLKSFAVAAK
ncbi:MAG: SIS domain-containing protein [Candidatus Acidiferrum sp.]